MEIREELQRLEGIADYVKDQVWPVMRRNPLGLAAGYTHEYMNQEGVLESKVEQLKTDKALLQKNIFILEEGIRFSDALKQNMETNAGERQQIQKMQDELQELQNELDSINQELIKQEKALKEKKEEKAKRNMTQNDKNFMQQYLPKGNLEGLFPHEKKKGGERLVKELEQQQLVDVQTHTRDGHEVRTHQRTRPDGDESNNLNYRG